MPHRVDRHSRSSENRTFSFSTTDVSRQRYVIEQGAIPPLCELLSVTDTKIIQVAFNGLENILKLGAIEAKRTTGPNPYAIMIEECFGT